MVAGLRARMNLNQAQNIVADAPRTVPGTVYRRRVLKSPPERLHLSDCIEMSGKGHMKPCHMKLSDKHSFISSSPSSTTSLESQERPGKASN
jgi:hypothetical protein